MWQSVVPVKLKQVLFIMPFQRKEIGSFQNMKILKLNKKQKALPHELNFHHIAV